MGRRLIVCLVPALALVVGCGGDERTATTAANKPPVVEDPGPIHVHGLGINRRDGALFIATHTGLFRAPQGQTKARRVAGRYQDTMGFTIVGRDRFLGSGHPDGREKLPPFLGLIESRDAGQKWHPISLLGKADFHVLEAAGQQVYGFGFDFKTRRQQLLVSGDGGRTWAHRQPPEPLIAIAIDSRDSQRVIAAGEVGVYVSGDGGRRWRSLPGEAGLLEWPARERLYRTESSGKVSLSSDGGSSWRVKGEVGGPAAAFDAPGNDLYVALHDGTIKRSTDGGASWSVRSNP